MIPRVLHFFSGKQFVCHVSLFNKEKKKSVIRLSPFSNSKFLFITTDVLNSARFDSISFFEKF